MRLSQTWILVLVAAVTLIALVIYIYGLGSYTMAIVLPGVFGAVLYWCGDADPLPSVKPAQTVPSLPAGFGRALLQQMPSPLLVIAQNGRVSYANPAAFALFPELQVNGHYSSLFRAPTFVEAFKAVRGDGSDRAVSFTASMGQERHFEAKLSTLPAGTDLGEREQIIVQVEDRTRDRLAVQTRSDFVANASHELRTPLASIVGYIETLQHHAKDDPEARERFLQIMAREAARMHRLIDDLMSLSRIEMNAHVRPVEAVDLYQVAGEAAAALFPLATQSDVTVAIELPLNAPGPRVRADRDQLNQVFVNLIDNAIKYSAPGQEVRLTAAPDDLRFPAMAGIAVIDTGAGIPREHLHRLTERFYRVSPNPARARNAGRTGTGLGLAIVKHILNRHGGGLDVTSREGEGSCFSVWLPVLNALTSTEDAAPQNLENAI